MSSSTAVGIDIAKLKFDVALLRDGKFKSKVFSNNDEGFAEFHSWLKAHDASSVPACMEATGSYFEAPALFLADHQLTVSVVNPLLISKYAEAIGESNKTDQQDARTIARYCATQSPKAWLAPTPAIRELRDLVRRLEALQGLDRQEQNRLGVASSITRPSIDAVLATLATQIVEITAAIKTHINDHPDLSSKAKVMDSIPGLGEATIVLILSELPASVRLSTRIADAFTGLAPTRHESGSSVKGRSHLSKRGASCFRKGLYFRAIVACMYNPVVKVFYERMQKNGLTKKQAFCAAMRKLLHIIIGVLKSGKPFDPDLHKIT